MLQLWTGRKVQDITKRDVITLLDTVRDRAPVMANRNLAAIRKLFNWCLARDVITVSPCNGVAPPAPERSRDRVLRDDELSLIWHAADGVGGAGPAPGGSVPIPPPPIGPPPGDRADRR